MSGRFWASPPSAIYSEIQSKPQTSRCCNSLWSSSSVVVPRVSRDHPLCSSDLKLIPTRVAAADVLPKISLRCNSSATPGGTAPGESDSRSVLDAFFLGKAVAEALTERIESKVGDFLSTVGRLQAEQQTQVQEFQEEVLERAKRAKEKAAHEAMEGVIPTTPSPTDGETPVASP